MKDDILETLSFYDECNMRDLCFIFQYDCTEEELTEYLDKMVAEGTIYGQQRLGEQFYSTKPFSNNKITVGALKKFLADIDDDYDVVINNGTDVYGDPNFSTDYEACKLDCCKKFVRIRGRII